MADLDPAPERNCFGCGQTDTHPRTVVVRDVQRPELDELYHYDCLPKGLGIVHDVGGQAGIDATAAGLRGDDVATAVVEAAQSDSDHVTEENH